MTQKKVVAILGGAFDPIHNDHMCMASECLNLKFCDEVWLMPSPDRWDKQPHASSKDRLAMAECAVQNHKNIKVSDFEIRNGNFRGSYILLKQMNEAYKECEFRLVIGSDTYPSMPLWRDFTSFKDKQYNGHLLLEEFSLIIFPRNTTPMPNQEEHNEKGYKPFYIVESNNVGDISSTEVRSCINNCSSLVPKAVEVYIQDHALYRDENVTT